MKKFTKINQVRKYVKKVKQKGKTLGFVPTMGYLHEGHLSLVDEAKIHADVVIMSIFVNPTQFGPNEDFDSYPRNIERDESLARDRGVDAIFYPEVSEIYPGNDLTWVIVDKITKVLCGARREGHFKGVTTVVTKLFNIVQPDVAVFGQKDAQQAAVITKMVNDLNMPVEIRIAPIIREADGLAMSSRNVRLSEEQRKNARVISRSLFGIEKGLNNGKMLPDLLKKAKDDISSTKGAELEYLEARSYPALELIDEIHGKCVIAVAVRFGNVRLIDNIIVNP